ncbi:hypothetical protein MTR67_020428 [Solanum verrucosum]|uniref:Cystatin domain-containing protein n=1 Tax=Solanum verrucosum TaxID=315347 RepID=A0AAF0QPP3_SOLVR|nr:hypothetical protein MTR67_020428 [Solanum verrucosum]
MDCLKYAMHTAMCLERDYPKRAFIWEKDIIDSILNKKEKYVIENYEQLNADGEEKINNTLKYQTMVGALRFFHNSKELRDKYIFFIGHNDGQPYSLEEEEEDIVTFAGGRKMSCKHRKEYITRAMQGFDITLDLELNAALGGPVVPLRGDYHKPTCIELSRMAIDKFNNENAQNYEFVEILNMNGQKGGGIWYYITFNAKDAVKTFQALGWEGIRPELDVSFCRLKKSSQP